MLTLSACVGPSHQAYTDWKNLCESSAERNIYLTVDHVDGFLYERESRFVNLDTGEIKSSYFPPTPYYEFLWDQAKTGYKFTEFQGIDKSKRIIPGIVFQASLGSAADAECNISEGKETSPVKLDPSACVFERENATLAAQYKVSVVDTTYDRNVGAAGHTALNISTRQITISEIKNGYILAKQNIHQIFYFETKHSAWEILIPYMAYVDRAEVKIMSCSSKSDIQNPPSERLQLIEPEEVLTPAGPDERKKYTPRYVKIRPE